MKFSQNILRHELVGLNLEIVKSTNENLIATKGRVIDETRNTLVLEKENGKEITRITSYNVCYTKLLRIIVSFFF